MNGPRSLAAHPRPSSGRQPLVAVVMSSCLRPSSWSAIRAQLAVARHLCHARQVSTVVAIIGASTDRRKFGNKALRAFRHAGYTVVPINPHLSEVEGERAYARVQDYPGVLDEATVYVPPPAGIAVMNDLAAKGVRKVWLNPGADAPAVVARARELGLQPVVACSILGIGESPRDY
jgi:predicted CoA-binding protein